MYQDIQILFHMSTTGRSREGLPLTAIVNMVSSAQQSEPSNQRIVTKNLRLTGPILDWAGTGVVAASVSRCLCGQAV
jgi:hypothetical protein